MTKDNILIFGAGFIGKRLKESFGCGISSKNIVSLKDIEDELDKYKPEVIVNCIGYTGAKNVDGCESNKDKTLFANTFIPVMFAEVALRRKVKLVHISSGCIYRFDYSKDEPIVEEKPPDFFDLFYSRSKIYAERALEPLSGKADILIVRPRIPLDDRPDPRNIITKLINYKKVIDILNTHNSPPATEKILKN